MSADPTQPPPPPPPEPTAPLPGHPGGPPDGGDGRSFWVIVAIVVAILVVAGVIAAFALSNNDDEPTTTSPTGGSTTAATGPSQPTGPTATGSTGGTGGTGSAANLGCSGGAPAPDTLPDGEYFGYVKSVNTASQTMSFDLACFYTGDEANQQAAMRGDEVPVPNDVYIVNDNPKTRDLTLGSSVELLLIDWNDCCETKPGADLDALATAIDANGFTTVGGWKYNGPNSPYWVMIQDGQAVKVEEQFLP